MRNTLAVKAVVLVLCLAAAARGGDGDAGSVTTPRESCERRPDDELLFDAETPGSVRRFDSASMREHEVLFPRLSAVEQIAIAVYSGDVLWFHMTTRIASRKHITAAIQLLRSVESKAAQDKVLSWITEVANRRGNLVAPFRTEILRERSRVLECASPQRLPDLEGYFVLLARLPSESAPQ